MVQTRGRGRERRAVGDRGRWQGGRSDRHRWHQLAARQRDRHLRLRREDAGIVIGDKSLWRKGVASEAMALRTAFCFRELNLHKIKTRAFVENEASKRALQKAGYRESGIQREEMYKDGGWHDIWMGEVMREDWEKAQKTR